ncbi:hypothetical protein L596_007710 [Steinernema carpocapsae]|uniref:Uncharacterized protein n=1 Tax=Steinernema carpocapsae TaxID=34508 RepID=A0A4U5PB72_STECR|nr:hypothetical protein L596_007710 [Steinernema carpocapsae]
MRDSCPAAFRNFDDRSSVDVSFTSGGIPYISRSCSVSGRCITHFRLFEDGLFGGIKRCSQSLIGLWLIFIGLPSIGLDFRLSPQFNQSSQSRLSSSNRKVACPSQSQHTIFFSFVVHFCLCSLQIKHVLQTYHALHTSKSASSTPTLDHCPLPSSRLLFAFAFN